MLAYLRGISGTLCWLALEDHSGSYAGMPLGNILDLMPPYLLGTSGTLCWLASGQNPGSFAVLARPRPVACSTATPREHAMGAHALCMGPDSHPAQLPAWCRSVHSSGSAPASGLPRVKRCSDTMGPVTSLQTHVTTQVFPLPPIPLSACRSRR